MGAQKDLFEGYEFPTTNEQEVLLTFILKGHVSFLDFSYMQGYRTRVSNLILIHGLKLERVTDTRVNKFGNLYTYAIYKLPQYEKENAIELYKKLNKNYEKTLLQVATN